MTWVVFTSGLFFLIAKYAVQLGISKEEILRLSEQDEILGGDLYYFGPIRFEGQIEDYDVVQANQNNHVSIRESIN